MDHIIKFWLQSHCHSHFADVAVEVGSGREMVVEFKPLSQSGVNGGGDTCPPGSIWNLVKQKNISTVISLGPTWALPSACCVIWSSIFSSGAWVSSSLTSGSYTNSLRLWDALLCAGSCYLPIWQMRKQTKEALSGSHSGNCTARIWTQVGR